MKYSKIPKLLKWGEKFSLTRAAGSAGLSKIKIVLGWYVRSTAEKPFQMYSSVLLPFQFGIIKIDSGRDFFAAQGDGADILNERPSCLGMNPMDVLEADLEPLLAKEFKKLAIAVAIHEARERDQSFGAVTNAFVCIANAADDNQLAEFEILSDASQHSAKIFAEVFYEDGEWMMKGVNHGYDGSDALFRYFGYEAGST